MKAPTHCAQFVDFFLKSKLYSRVPKITALVLSFENSKQKFLRFLRNRVIVEYSNEKYFVEKHPKARNISCMKISRAENIPPKNIPKQNYFKVNFQPTELTLEYFFCGIYNIWDIFQFRHFSYWNIFWWNVFRVGCSHTGNIIRWNIFQCISPKTLKKRKFTDCK